MVFENKSLSITQALVGLAGILVLAVRLVRHAQSELYLAINSVVNSPVKQSSDHLKFLREL
jgi:hypothetical protein